jgi:hypothetical protein
MSLNPAAKPASGQLPAVTKVQSRADYASTPGVKAPVVKRSERLPEPALAIIANQLDAFIEAGSATNAAIVARLKTAADGESIKDLDEATSAMRRFAVCQFFKRDVQPDLSDPALKTFARLWPKAEALVRSEQAGDHAPVGIDLEFGLAFSLMIHRINGAEVTLTPRK